VKKRVEHPVLFLIRYRDGLRASLFTLNPAVGHWTAAWRYKEDGKVESTLMLAQGAFPFVNFAPQTKGIEQMILTGKPAWPAERTLYTSGLLDCLLISKKDNGRIVETPFLDIRYESDWDWQQIPGVPGE
jgi:hypothetical protein